VDSDSSGLGSVDCGSMWLVIMPKSKYRFVERSPMRTVQEGALGDLDQHLR
jgi:hypothetical protein